MKPAYAKPTNQKYLKFILLLFLIVFLYILFVLLFENSNKKENLCENDLEKFDEYIISSALPITENPKSLCHEINMSTNFSELEPKWAVAKFIGLNLEYQYGLTFEGNKKTETINIPMNETEVSKFQVDEFYKIDMNNICRYFFMMADSRSPSPIESTFTKPELINCTN